MGQRDGCLCIKNYFRQLVTDFECPFHGEALHIARRLHRMIDEAARPTLDDRGGEESHG